MASMKQSLSYIMRCNLISLQTKALHYALPEAEPRHMIMTSGEGVRVACNDTQAGPLFADKASERVEVRRKEEDTAAVGCNNNFLLRPALTSEAGLLFAGYTH